MKEVQIEFSAMMRIIDNYDFEITTRRKDLAVRGELINLFCLHKFKQKVVKLKLTVSITHIFINEDTRGEFEDLYVYVFIPSYRELNENEMIVFYLSDSEQPFSRYIEPIQ